MKKKFIISILACLMAVPAMMGQQRQNLASLVDETLTYDVMYKWGFINKVAGFASMSLRNDGDLLRASVFAENAPWANSIYMLRDTLYTTMTKQGLYPVEYTYIAHEAGKYKKDVITFTHTGNDFSAKAVRYKRKSEGQPMTSSTVDFQAQGMTVDMLSSFFYLRSLDFEGMKPGAQTTVNIISGSKVEKLKMTYVGKSTIESNGEELPCYRISFTFTRKGVESSAPISGWLTADSRRIPVRIEGKLPVGKVKAIYTGPNP